MLVHAAGGAEGLADHEQHQGPVARFIFRTKYSERPRTKQHCAHHAGQNGTKGNDVDAQQNRMHLPRRSARHGRGQVRKNELLGCLGNETGQCRQPDGDANEGHVRVVQEKTRQSG